MKPPSGALREAGSLEAAHARIWARWGQRADAATWQRIEIAREAGAVLDIARGSALASWVEGLAAGQPLHDIERRLRERLRERIAELGAWLPAPWQPALAWCEWLIDLPLLQRAARDEPWPPWAADDPALQALIQPSAAAGSGVAPRRRAADPRRALLDAARGDPGALLPLWLEGFRVRLPADGGRAAVELLLLPLLLEHARAFASPQIIDGRAARAALVPRLVRLLRRHPVEPVSAFAYLALVALEFERLRGEIIVRAALAPRSA